MGVVHLFILYRDDEPVLIKVGKVAWSLLLSENSLRTEWICYAIDFLRIAL